MKIIQSRIFAKRVKKFTQKDKLKLDNVIKEIIGNPSIGTQKQGDLKEVFVIKFKIGVIQYLLAYRIKNNNLELIKIDVHENYYRDLKQYLH